MDTNIGPCTNFYQYSRGLWRAKNPIPPDRARWGRFDELAEHNLEVERAILEKSAQISPNRSALDQKIGDYYAARTDETAIERKGVTPIKPQLDEIDALRSKDQPAAMPSHAATASRSSLRMGDATFAMTPKSRVRRLLRTIRIFSASREGALEPGES